MNNLVSAEIAIKERERTQGNTIYGYFSMIQYTIVATSKMLKSTKIFCKNNISKWV